MILHLPMRCVISLHIYITSIAFNSIESHDYQECSSYWNTWDLWNLCDDSKSIWVWMDGCLLWECGEAHLHPKLAGTGRVQDVLIENWTVACRCKGGDAAEAEPPKTGSRRTEAAGCLYFCCYSLNSVFMTHKDKRPRSYRSLFNTYSRPTCDWNKQQWGRGL